MRTIAPTPAVESILGPRKPRMPRAIITKKEGSDIALPDVSTSEDTNSMARFQSSRAREILEDMDKCGEPIFVAKDILATTDMFARLVRMFCVHRNITWDYFYARHRAYCESMGYAPHQINYDRNNCKRALIRPTMTKNYFEYFCQAMGIIITDMSVGLVTADGVSGTYSLTDAERISRMRMEDCQRSVEGPAPWDVYNTSSDTPTGVQ